MSTILAVLAGSHAYGLQTPESDVDTIEVYVEDVSHVLGPCDPAAESRAQHHASDDDDLTRYPLRRFLKLALRGNPAVIESLYSPRLNIVCGPREWDLGTELIALGRSGAFLSRQLIPRYRGYMRAQMLRLLGLRGGHSAGKEKRKTEASERAGYDTKYAMHITRLGYFCEELVAERYLTLPVDVTKRMTLRLIRNGDVPFDMFFRAALALDERLGKLYDDDCLLADEPEIERVTKWSIAAHLRSYG